MHYILQTRIGVLVKVNLWVFAEVLKSVPAAAYLSTPLREVCSGEEKVNGREGRKK